MRDWSLPVPRTTQAPCSPSTPMVIPTANPPAASDPARYAAKYRLGASPYRTLRRRAQNLRSSLRNRNPIESRALRSAAPNAAHFIMPGRSTPYLRRSGCLRWAAAARFRERIPGWDTGAGSYQLRGDISARAACLLAGPVLSSGGRRTPRRGVRACARNGR